jgi:hypothetical protein
LARADLHAQRLGLLDLAGLDLGDLDNFALGFDFLFNLCREHPRLGRQLERYAPRDVRRLIVGNYELQYELRHDVILVLRIWHGREDR